MRWLFVSLCASILPSQRPLFLYPPPSFLIVLILCIFLHFVTIVIVTPIVLTHIPLKLFFRVHLHFELHLSNRLSFLSGKDFVDPLEPLLPPVLDTILFITLIRGTAAAKVHTASNDSRFHCTLYVLL